MSPKLLLDSHVPYHLSDAVRALLPGIDIQHVSGWQGGVFLDSSDDLLLEAYWQDRRALISKDRATLPRWLALRISEGKEHGGILFYDSERFKAIHVGALARAVVTAIDQLDGDFANRWVTLR